MAPAFMVRTELGLVDFYIEEVAKTGPSRWSYEIASGGALLMKMDSQTVRAYAPGAWVTAELFLEGEALPGA